MLEDLGIDPWNLIVQLIAFVLFVFLLWRFALGPITAAIDRRTDKIRGSLEAAERMQAELRATAARNEELLAEARREAQQIVSNARDAADAIIARAREEASKQAEEYLNRAEETLRQETAQAREQLRQEVADLAIMAASRIIRKELDPATQTRLIQETLAEAGATSQNAARSGSLAQADA